jgi:hypothetical protein
MKLVCHSRHCASDVEVQFCQHYCANEISVYLVSEMKTRWRTDTASK